MIEKNAFMVLKSIVTDSSCALIAIARWDHRFEFHKRSQLFIRTHNEALTFAAMCVSNKDRSPARIHCCNAAPTLSAKACPDENSFSTRV